MVGPSLNKIADKFAASNVGSIFIYTYEAHPGEHYPHLTSMEQKFEHAAALRDVLGVTRTIVLDALDGACHRAYGSQPNMSWIINRAGQPVYKADWTDPGSIEDAIAYFVDVAERRRERELLGPFHVERLDYRNRDRKQFFAGLERNGPRSVEEYRKVFGDD